MGVPFKSLFGQYLGLGVAGNLVAKQGGAIRQVSRPAVHAVITISAEGATTANTRDLTVALFDAYGKALTYAEQFEIVLFTSSAMVDFVAVGGSTGVVQGTIGKLLAIVAKKIFRCMTSVTGTWNGTYLDTGVDVGYLAVKLPNGNIIGGGLITNA